MSVFLVYILVPLMKESYWPFIRRGALAEIHEEKKEGLWAISDIDFEYEMGKLTREDYASTREFLKKQTLPVLEREKNLSEKIILKPKKEISRDLKKDINKEVLRICGKRLFS
jgi:hypothetical protein